MTQTILIAIIWLFIGLWICFKRDWYKYKKLYLIGDRFDDISIAVMFAPINLIITLTKQYCIAKWDNN